MGNSRGGTFMKDGAQLGPYYDSLILKKIGISPEFTWIILTEFIKIPSLCLKCKYSIASKTRKVLDIYLI